MLSSLVWQAVVNEILSFESFDVLNEFYSVFQREDFRKEFQEQNPDVKSMRDVSVAHVF